MMEVLPKARVIRAAMMVGPRRSIASGLQRCGTGQLVALHVLAAGVVVAAVVGPVLTVLVGVVTLLAHVAGVANPEGGPGVLVRIRLPSLIRHVHQMGVLGAGHLCVRACRQWVGLPLVSRCQA